MHKSIFAMKKHITVIEFGDSCRCVKIIFGYFPCTEVFYSEKKRITEINFEARFGKIILGCFPCTKIFLQQKKKITLIKFECLFLVSFCQLLLFI